MGVAEAVPAKPAPPPPGNDYLALSYTAILKQVPKELYGKLAPAGAAGGQFSVARAEVFEQLPKGAVKVTFGQLRQSAPAGVFINSSAYDGKLIDLPLADILKQLEPQAFTRRPGQRVVEISPEVLDIFGAKGERITPGTARGEPSSPAPTVRHTVVVAPTIAPALRVAPAVPAAPVGVAKPAVPIKSVAPAKPIDPAPRTAARLPKAAPAREVASSVKMESGPFLLALAEVADCWPEPVRQELSQLKLPDAKCALPAAELCEGLKRGKVQYPWNQIRSWIQDAPAPDAPSPYAQIVLDFPLNIITPLFLDFIRSTPSPRKVGSAEHITEFFRKARESTSSVADGDEPDLPSVTYQQTVVAQVSPALPLPPLAPSAPVTLPVPTPPVASARATPVTPIPAPARTGAEWVTFDAERGLLSIPLAMLMAEWPEPILEEVNYFEMTNACVELPLSVIQGGLKLGRVDHSWKEVCAWIPDCPPSTLESANAETRLLLPLSVIAPLYFKHRPGSNTPAKKPAVSLQGIPDLFNAAGTPSAPPPAPMPEPAAAPKPAPKPTVRSVAAPVAPVASAPATPVAARPPKNLAELFGEPEKRNWSPNDIVHATSRLPGVAGALIALQDGLLVASRMPDQFNTETIAAFVPQMFGRMNQYAKELQLGAVGSLSFGVEPGTLQIFKAGIIYFAVLSQPDQPLPMTDLIFIAHELNRQSI